MQKQIRFYDLVYVKGYIITLLYFLEASGLILTLRASVAAFKVELSNLITFSLHTGQSLVMKIHFKSLRSNLEFGLVTTDIFFKAFFCSHHMLRFDGK